LFVAYDDGSNRICQIGLRIDTVQFAGLDQRNRTIDTAAYAACLFSVSAGAQFQGSNSSSRLIL